MEILGEAVFGILGRGGVVSGEGAIVLVFPFMR